MRLGNGAFADLVTQRIREWEVRQHVRGAESAGPAQRASVVTISRQLGSGGSEVAEAVAAALRWDVWDRQLVEDVARSARVRTRAVESLDERTRSQVQAIGMELLGERFEEIGYRRHLVQVILTIAEHGSAVIVGRGANFVLPKAFNVRVVAPPAARAARLAAREGVSERDALRRCADSDRERAEFTRSLFGREIDDPLAYDLMVNTNQLQPAGAVELILAGVRITRS
ncbi:MAG: cytidylate kinase family protein [Armatimonadetes bacterium]|nr:cytidylate kinase family protein [Armatimonadota bacterium]